ncbi:aldo/keto reductase [Acidiferrimicrobium sp. IK]|uniref:aldo/keto reductase n=1 Tax=Acidiferrimicrobium sp. IK TaxID=2871700 RepID=UPI0021CB265F|nr:aldo/keto reductase [Acidiferrimicrobium sp. IK]MCU4186094.1 aldo/keto reductase [Acidiferrimicrobium sp. IK]
MRYRQLGTSGLTVSVVGLGCNNFGMRLGLEDSRRVVDAAIEAGITLLDTSNTYGNRGGSEAILGEVLEGRRDQVVLATKWGMDMGDGPGDQARGSRRYIRRAVEDSLRRLRTDWIDLYQLHRPDPLTPIGETLAALDELIDEGKVRYIGSSNFAPWQVADADWTARSAGTERMISAQNHYSLLERGAEKELLPACEHFGVGVLPFFPLANGLLTGKHSRGGLADNTRMAGRDVPDATWDTVEALAEYALERGRSLLEVAIGSLAARRPVASVIAGATKVEQVHANVAAGEWVPSEEDLAALSDVLVSPDRR